MQFVKKTSSRTNFIRLTIKFVFVLIVALVTVFVLSKVDFPAPKKDIEKIIPNENFKTVK